MVANTFLEIELTLCQVLCANIWQTFLPCGHWPLERINYAPQLLLSPHCMELARHASPTCPDRLSAQ